MRPEMANFQSLRRGWSNAAIVALLGAAAVAGDGAIFSVLRGQQERSLEPIGYYEGLLHTPGAGRTEIGPPPGWIAFGAAETGIVQEVPSYLRWTMKPNLDLRWNGSVFRTNSLGCRSPEVSLKKPAGTYRILVFGSSNTMGYGVDNEQMYSLLLEHWLNESKGRNDAVEVINLAVSGDSPSRRLFRIQQEAGRLSPDWILCDVSYFDPWLEDRQIQSSIERHVPIPFPFVEAAIRRTGAKGGVRFDEFGDAFRGESERLLEDVYAGLAAESRRIRVPLTLLVLPRSDSKDKSERLRAIILEIANRHGLDRLDLSDAFDDLPLEAFRISEWDKHTSAGGHRVIFEAIRDALIARGRLPERGGP
jgi:lysophospholipase L1-like esterase